MAAFKSKMPAGFGESQDGKLSTQDIAYLQAIEKNVASTSDGLAGYSTKLREQVAVADTTYTFVLTDNGAYVRFTSGSAVTVTVPAEASVAFDVGTQIDVIQVGAGKVTFGGSVTINSLSGNKSLGGQYAGGTLIKVDSDVWDLVGNLIP